MSGCQLKKKGFANPPQKRWGSLSANQTAVPLRGMQWGTSKKALKEASRVPSKHIDLETFYQLPRGEPVLFLWLCMPSRQTRCVLPERRRAGSTPVTLEAPLGRMFAGFWWVGSLPVLHLNNFLTTAGVDMGQSSCWGLGHDHLLVKRLACCSLDKWNWPSGHPFGEPLGAEYLGGGGGLNLAGCCEREKKLITNLLGNTTNAPLPAELNSSPAKP